MTVIDIHTNLIGGVIVSVIKGSCPGCVKMSHLGLHTNHSFTIYKQNLNLYIINDNKTD